MKDNFEIAPLFPVLWKLICLTAECRIKQITFTSDLSQVMQWKK